MDVAFAVTATSKDADQVFELMKNTIKSLAASYDSDRIRYSLITFADDAAIQVHFKENLEVDELKEKLKTIERVVGRPALDKALESASSLFSDVAGERLDADRALVVMTDKTSRVDEDDIMDAAKNLEKLRVKVIAVAIGDEVGSTELEVITAEENVIKVQENKHPEELRELIMQGVLSMYSCIFVFIFH